MTRIRPMYKLVFLYLFSTSVMAGTISGQHFTNDGKEVALQGLEWLALDHTFAMSRQDVEDGFIDHVTGQTWQAGDWRYATVAETYALLNSLFGGEYLGYDVSNYDGAKWFLENFYSTGVFANRRFWTNELSISLLYGAAGECGIGTTCVDFIQAGDNYSDYLFANDINTLIMDPQHYAPNSGEVGVIGGVNGVIGHVVHGRHLTNRDVTEDSYGTGSLLVRTVVPVPAAVWLFVSGILALIGCARAR